MRLPRALFLAGSLAILPQSFLFSQAIVLVGESTNFAQGGPLAGLKFNHEYEVNYSYVGEGEIHRGNLSYGDFSEQTARANYVASTAVASNVYLRGGVNYDYFSFDIPRGGSAVPNSFQGIAPVIGADFQITDKLLMRFETQPGVYSDFQDISFDDVNIPTVIGGSYLYNADLQFFFGLSVDPRRQYPVLPGGGVRWKFAKDWTLFAVLPAPRIEYNVNEKLTVFAGAEAKGGTYTVGKDFGTRAGIPSLDNDAMEYTEIRAGAGAKYEVLAGTVLSLDAGYMVYRRFEFHASGVQLGSEPAPYVQIGLSGKF